MLSAQLKSPAMGLQTKSHGSPYRRWVRLVRRVPIFRQYGAKESQLQNVVERCVVFTEGDTFSADESWFKCGQMESLTELDGLPALAKREVEMIKFALAECDGRLGASSGAAAKLKVPRQTLESKIRRFGIDDYLQNIRSAK